MTSNSRRHCRPPLAVRFLTSLDGVVAAAVVAADDAAAGAGVGAAAVDHVAVGAGVAECCKIRSCGFVELLNDRRRLRTLHK